MIAAVCWVPKGAAKEIPAAAEPPSQEEIEELLREGGLDAGQEDDELSDDNAEDDEDEQMEASPGDGRGRALAAAEALGSRRSVHSGIDDVADGLRELDMEHYDDEDDEIKIFGNGGIGSAYYQNGEEDPYITNKDEDDEAEVDDMTIRASDLLILTARNEDDVSHLEVWVYEEGDEPNMYVHHDIMLPAYPLSLAWLDCNLKGGEKGNFVAVGSMQPEIEIWDLDMLDEVEPAIVLGGPVPEESKKKKKKKKMKEGSHKDAVLGLSWNTEYRNVLGSGSADQTVKVWDIAAQKCVHTFKFHSNKVQAVAWNPSSSKSLLSGSFDRNVVLTDVLSPDKEAGRAAVAADVESLAWNPHNPESFVVSLEDGVVQGFDTRTMKCTFTINAHEKATTAVSFNLVAPNLLATASTDKTLKLWDVSDDKPSCLASIKPKVGGIFAAVFCKDSPFLLACGGSKGELQVWNTLDEASVAHRYGNYVGR